MVFPGALRKVFPGVLRMHMVLMFVFEVFEVDEVFVFICYMHVSYRSQSKFVSMDGNTEGSVVLVWNVLSG